MASASAITIRRVQSASSSAARRAPAPMVRRGSSGMSRLKAKFAERAAAASRRAAAIAREEKHTLTAIGGAVALGLFERYAPETIERITVAGLKPAAVLGLAAWGLNRFGIVRNTMMEHAATGMLAVAAYDLAKTIGSDLAKTIEGLEPQNAIDFDR
jgi:hypothetical protein